MVFKVFFFVLRFLFLLFYQKYHLNKSRIFINFPSPKVTTIFVRTREIAESWNFMKEIIEKRKNRTVWKSIFRLPPNNYWNILKFSNAIFLLTRSSNFHFRLDLKLMCLTLMLWKPTNKTFQVNSSFNANKQFSCVLICLSFP